jgi:hypothetical protein
MSIDANGKKIVQNVKVRIAPGTSYTSTNPKDRTGVTKRSRTVTVRMVDDAADYRLEREVKLCQVLVSYTDVDSQNAFRDCEIFLGQTEAGEDAIRQASLRLAKRFGYAARITWAGSGSYWYDCFSLCTELITE